MRNRFNRSRGAGPDPVEDAAARGELTLASWRVWTYDRLERASHRLASLLFEKTGFEPDSPRKPLLAAASAGSNTAMRRIGLALLDPDDRSDIAWSWITLAAHAGCPIAQQAILQELVWLADTSRGAAARRLWRVARSWALMAKLASVRNSRNEELRNALEDDAPPVALNVDTQCCDLEPTSKRILTCPIPADKREEIALAKAWDVLTHPLPLRAGPPVDVLEAVLLMEFPWLSAAISAVADDLRLRTWAGQPWAKWRPLLMVGPPGTGKTRLARRIATLVGVGFGEINAAGSVDNRLLQGTARGWSTSSPSQVLHVIRRSGCANPVMLVDEIDKCQASQNGDLRATLLTMLEPLTARSWPDECLMTPADLSSVNWVLCANDLTPLRGPLLNRLRVVEAHGPKPEHLPQIVESIRRDIAEELDLQADDLPPISETLQDALQTALRRGVTLRRMKSAVETALLAGGPPPRRIQ